MLTSQTGQNRQLHSTHIGKYDIVITTYNTVALEWKKHKRPQLTTAESQLFENYWHRIILDEAHVIRNRMTANAKAVCALEGEHRWCMTGTPIQNRLADIFSLLRFLRVYPYDNFAAFDSDIMRPWKTAGDEDALKRLQSLVKMIAIRRSKAIIDLPNRHESNVVVHFSEEERAVYDKARAGAIEEIECAINVDTSRKSAYLNAFQRINNLRYG